jgi:3-oxoadipate enol-lactonase
MPQVNINGGTISYEEHGQGKPLVLVHGFPLDRRIWQHQVAGLAGQCRVIAPDLPGFGQSAAARPFTIPSLAADLHQFLRQIDALPCILGGLSMGGYVAFAFLTSYLADLSGLLLIDTKCEADTAEAKAGRLRMAEIARTRGAGAIADEMEPKMTATDADPQVRQRLRRIMEDCPPATIEMALLAMRGRDDYRDKLPSVAVPTLIIVGDQDAIIPQSLCNSMCHEIPHCEMTIIPGAGHLSPMEKPAEVTEAIRRWLGRL